MKRTIIRETTFVVLLTVSVFLLALATACGYDSSSPYSPPTEHVLLSSVAFWPKPPGLPIN